MEHEILNPLPTARRNADDMGIPSVIAPSDPAGPSKVVAAVAGWLAVGARLKNKHSTVKVKIVGQNQEGDYILAAHNGYRLNRTKDEMIQHWKPTANS